MNLKNSGDSTGFEPMTSAMQRIISSFGYCYYYYIGTMSPLEGPSTITDFFREPFSSRVIFERLSIIISQIDRKASIAIAHR